MLKVEHQKVTIIGGGKVAYRKAKQLIQESCQIQVIAPLFIEAFQTMEHCVQMIQRPYKEGDCAGSLLVFAATNDTNVNREVAYYCKKQGILCNVVDNPSFSGFITPAQITRGDLKITISTEGNSPNLAVKIKREIEQLYDETYSEYVQLLGTVRTQLVTVEKDIQKKQQMLHDLTQLSYDELVHYSQTLMCQDKK